MSIAEELVPDKAPLTGDLPEGWAFTALGEICEKITDGTHKTPQYVDNGIPFVSTANIIPFRIGFDFSSYQRFITLDEHQELTKRCHPKKGDILVSKCGTIGRAKEVDVDYPFSIFVGLALLKPYNGMFASKFAEYLFNYEQITKELERLSPGSTRKTLTLAAIRTLKFPVAPFAEQKRIVAKVEQLLARVNGARERLAKVPAVLKRFRQSVLAAACSGRLTADWRENNTSVTSSELSIREILRLHQKQWVLEKGSAKKYKQPKSVRTERLPEVPESWKRVSSDALFSFVTSGSRGWAKYYSESGSTFIRIGNLDHDTITLDLSQIKRVNPPRGAERQRTRVQPGDILVSITADVGMTALVPDGIGEAYVNQHVAIARPVAGVYQPWLAWYLASAKGGQAQFQNLQRGATKIGLGLDDIRSVTVPLPPVEEQKEIAKRIEIFFKMAAVIEKRVAAATAQAEKLTQAILAKAFRGKLVPTEAEMARREGRSYEPAPALLAKIEAQRKNVKRRRR